MEFSLFYQLRNKSWWMNVIFYVAVFSLIASVFCYFVFIFKMYLQGQQIAQVDKNIAIYGTLQQKNYEKEVFDYKKKIDDFATLVKQHKISSNIFGFLEEHTLPSVWFSSLDMSQSANEIRLAGEASTMEALSRQIQVFEDNKDYISAVSVLNSQVSSTGKIAFAINLSLGPNIFTYPSPLPSPSLSASVNPTVNNQ